MIDYREELVNEVARKYGLEAEETINFAILAQECESIFTVFEVFAELMGEI